jgi:hypothetical protein
MVITVDFRSNTSYTSLADMSSQTHEMITKGRLRKATWNVFGIVNGVGGNVSSFSSYRALNTSGYTPTRNTKYMHM